MNIIDGFVAVFRAMQSLKNSEAREPGRHASAASAGIMILLLLGAGSVRAATADGTLITNVACMTYGSIMSNCNFTATYCVTATVLVVNPNIQINKSASPSIECSGSTVTFCIWVANASAYTSAFNVHVIDIIPGSAGVMAYIQGQNNWVTGTAGATVTLGYGAQPPWNGFLYQQWAAECPAGQTGPYGLRWVVSLIGPGKSALLCWKASIL
jgi:uncharacterized repeat protein (TIGR01451 family)